ncbi:MAG: hypothetical protein AAGB97_04485 [Dehalococcoidia bacterium]|nr:hypothetical protein [Chloroflexota bacterium]MBT9160365.1 hypothetical protein [Chloroflexota bacterium]MBT9162038.1 hypothetical protein [Chloroflexota bacterium]
MRRNLYLYLTLACFVAIIGIFVVDGYMGIYDTLHITTDGQRQRIEPDHWPRQDWVWVSTWVTWGDKAFFRYEVDNRWFSAYTADIEVSVWRGQEKVLDLIAQQISVLAFDEGQVEWVIDTTELLPSDVPPEQRYDYTLIIKRAEIEREIIVHINPPANPPDRPVPPR